MQALNVSLAGDEQMDERRSIGADRASSMVSPSRVKEPCRASIPPASDQGKHAIMLTFASESSRY
jgi:hypothetical protein